MKRMIHFRTIATGTLIVVLHLLSSPSLVGQTGETVKNQKLGITFKAPKDWISIPIDPLETMTIHKYQAKRADDAKKFRGIRHTANLELLFFPVEGAATKETKAEEEEEPKTEEEEALEKALAAMKISNYTDYIEKRLKPQWKAEIKGKPSTKKVGKIKALFYDMMGAIRLTSGKTIPVRIRSAVFPTTGGEFVMQFACLDENYKKRHSKGMESSIRSFRLTDKVDTGMSREEMDQLSPNARYIQEQIDKLSRGWYHFYSSEKNYMIFSNGDKSFAREVAKNLEAIHACYVEAFPGKPRIGWIPIVRVCKTKNEYHGYGGPQGSAGYWSDMTKEFVFYNDVARGAKNTILVLKHEAFHHFIHFYLGCRPHTWFDEGCAEYFAGGEFVGSRIKIKPNQWRRGRIQSAMVKDAQVPLNTFMSMSKSRYYAQADLCYAQGWSLLYFLLSGKKQGAKMKKEWAAIPQVYLENLQEAFAKLEKEKPDDVADPDEVNYKLSDEAQTLALEKTFEGWTDDDWEAMEKAWVDFIK